MIIENPAAYAEGKHANPNKVNAVLCVAFEAFTLAFQIETDQGLLGACATALGRLLTSKEPNVRYAWLGMAVMSCSCGSDVR